MNKTKNKQKEVRKLGYCRVSKSDDSQNDSLETQIKLLESHDCYKIFFEKASGAKDNRKEFQKMIELAKELAENYDVSIVCYRLDRLGRNPRLIINTLAELEEVGVNIISISEGLDSNFTTGKMMIQMLSIVANWELTSIRARVQTGVDNARRNGKTLGRPKLSKATKNKVIRLYQLNSLSTSEIAKRCGISRKSVYNILQDSGTKLRRK